MHTKYLIGSAICFTKTKMRQKIVIDNTTRNKMTGKLDVIYGPMFAGKTGHMLSQLSREHAIGMKVLYINSCIDTREDAPFSTHSTITNRTLPFDSVKVERLEEVFDKIDDYDVIGLDEAQFYPNLKECVMKMVETHNKYVIVAGLALDSNREPFGEMWDLISLAENVKHEKSHCVPCSDHKRRTPAIFTYRRPDVGGEIVKAGGSESYLPVCRECYVALTECESYLAIRQGCYAK